MASEWPDEVRWVYVLCNPTHEKERFERIIPHLLMRGIPKERLRVCGPTWGSELDAQTMLRVYDPFLPRGDFPTFTYKSARLSKGEVSLVLNFYAAIQNAKKDLSGSDCILVLESDAWLRRDFVARLKDTLIAAKATGGGEWDYLSLGEGVGTRVPGMSKSYYGATKVFPAPHRWVFRCTDSMVFSARFVDRLATTLVPFKECLDWELNFQAILHQAKAMWVDPPLAEQGTTHGREDTFLK
jgi:hypothetical protein